MTPLNSGEQFRAILVLLFYSRIFEKLSARSFLILHFFCMDDQKRLQLWKASEKNSAIWSVYLDKEFYKNYAFIPIQFT